VDDSNLPGAVVHRLPFIIREHMSYNTAGKKGAGLSDQANWHYCREYKLRRDTTAGDNLNGSIPLSQDSLKAINAELGDKIKLHVRSNSNSINFEKSVYSTQPGVGLQKKERERLGLNIDNNVIEYWIKEADAPDSEVTETLHDGSRDYEEEEVTQQESLIEKESAGQQYVWFNGARSTVYHHVSSGGGSTTACGISFEGRECRVFTDPGDVLDECGNCAVRASNKMTNEELAEWIASQASFSTADGPPGYFNKSQLLSIRDYIVQLQDSQQEGG
jgi:hypothetical protein